MVQVCWLWRQVGERPGLWTWGVARSTGESMAAVLGSRRMLLVRRLRLQGGLAGSRDLLEAVTRLKKLEVTGAVLSSLSPRKLARTVSGLEEVQLSKTAVCRHQAEELFTAVTLETSLRKLYISQTVLSSLSPGQLAGAASCMVELSLPSTQLTSQQAEAILQAIGPLTRLKKLDLSDNKKLFWNTDPSLMAGAVELEEFIIRKTDSGSQRMSILLAAISRHTKLRKLDLDGNASLYFVEPGLLARAARWIEKLSIAHATITLPQIRAIFTTIAGPTRLNWLKIGEGDEERRLFGWKLGPAPALRDVRKKLTDVRKIKVLKVVSLYALETAFLCGQLKFSIEAHRLRMV